MAKDSSSDHFDAIVSGAGAAGLTSAALLAKAGRKVLLVEKEARIGGYIRAPWYPVRTSLTSAPGF
jgi:prolycopene isomerase